MKLICSISFLIVLLSTYPVLADIRFSDDVGVSNEQYQHLGSIALNKFDECATDGYAVAWVTLSLEYVDMSADPESLSAKEQRAQKRAIRKIFKDLMKPLISRGHARAPKSGFFVSGVSTLVKIDRTALQQLQASEMVFDILVKPKA